MRSKRANMQTVFIFFVRVKNRLKFTWFSLESPFLQQTCLTVYWTERVLHTLHFRLNPANGQLSPKITSDRICVMYYFQFGPNFVFI